MFDFNSLRTQYPDFIYHSYDYAVEDGCLNVKYKFEISNLETFEPRWVFPLPSDYNCTDTALMDNLTFSLGMVELISYWKATCSPSVIVKCAGLNDDMIQWWKSLYFGGLGEFFYVNGIKTDVNSFMNIISEGDIIAPSTPLPLEGNLVPVGGGKDSAVSLSILKNSDEISVPYIINSRGATEESCRVAGLFNEAYRVKRTIDKRLIELNSKGYLNGHTPFSAIVAFSSLIAAVINKKKYVVLSNESSANESTVLGEEINHQFSKGVEFENNFISYQKKYINCGVEYFSFLRPLSEMQIAALFSKYKEYHPVFKSCNAASKQDIWCCNCPKCMFVYIILSPFLTQDELLSIFGENLFHKAELLDTFKQLCGVTPNKPFECVGSRDEVLTACEAVCENLLRKGEELPYILKYFKDNVSIEHSKMSDYINFFDNDNNLPDGFLRILNDELEVLKSNV